jgi:hypothetical protein
MVQGTGGQPLSITQRIENDLQTFDRLAIKPVFIFSGIPTQSHGPPNLVTFQDKEDMSTRERAWDLYEEGDRMVEATHMFGMVKGTGDLWRDVFRAVLRTMKSRSVEYIVCPYSEQSQVCPINPSPMNSIDVIACLPIKPSQRIYPRNLFHQRSTLMASR